MHCYKLHALLLFAPVSPRLGARLPSGRTPKYVCYHYPSTSASLPGKKQGPDPGGPDKRRRLGEILLPFVDMLQGRSQTIRRSSYQEVLTQDDWKSPIYTLLFTQVLIYLASSYVTSMPASGFMSIQQLQWWQIVTNGLMSVTLQQLFESMFFTYIFGRPVERSYGLVGVWMAVLFAVVGANALLVWVAHSVTGTLALPCSSSPVGVLGLLFVGLVFPRLLRKPLEVACLAPFALWSVTQRCIPMSSMVIVDGLKVGHLVHLSGGLAGSLIAYTILSAVKLIKENAKKVERDKALKDKAAAVDETMSGILNSAADAATYMVKKLDK
ncbi:hypothetical protein CEUSTIGMA_g1446.t1 [Chlamydomonas eustigma]|uniref:Peptidase S54 rhomboid domain-containing protein n=1 Tax=Chlamydomonas eustigma TaxID=1157962 RepID=A0A250WTC1_9CHLO|nr:hypothetical protein CEUSTIGMA_g1446.t1 [Chlamydomonas eustigma]|eukprot:GAX73996.1 hypothetical protein CEUSTIGMA_g1446.t1 [Chlamydomonas eustigma]